MNFRDTTDFGPDHEPYLRNLSKKKLSVKLILFPSVLLLVFLVVFYFLDPTFPTLIMLGLCAIVSLLSLIMLNGYRMLTVPEDHYIKKKFDAKNFDKLSRTTIRKWADKNGMLTRKDAGVHYYYSWYAYPYAPIYYVVKLHYNEGEMYVYYLWPKQYLVASPDHPNISSPFSLYRLRERELKKDRTILEELEKNIKVR